MSFVSNSWHSPLTFCSSSCAGERRKPWGGKREGNNFPEKSRGYGTFPLVTVATTHAFELLHLNVALLWPVDLSATVDARRER